MTTGEWIVIAIFIVALLCSLSLFLWLRRIIVRDRGRLAQARNNRVDHQDKPGTVPLVQITEQTLPVHIHMAYATPHNLAGRQVYADSLCALRPEALACLDRAAAAARRAGYTLKILDAWRPAAAQALFWEVCPDPRYVADPARGSHHTRGVAVDVTLVDQAGQDLDMGTGFDDMREQSHHDCDDVSQTAQRHRYLLLGIMLQAGFESIPTEWWHYQLPNATNWPLINEWPEP